MARDVSDATPIESRDQLVEALSSGAKPKSAWRVGTEHEKFGFYRRRLQPVPYEGERGIRQLLEAMEGLLGWHPIVDEGNIIGLDDPTGLGAISLEPGGQFELSGAPLETIHQTCRETQRASRPGARMRRAARHRLPRPRRLAEVDARRDAGDAEIALRDHDATTCRRSAGSAST